MGLKTVTRVLYPEVPDSIAAVQATWPGLSVLRRLHYKNQLNRRNPGCFSGIHGMNTTQAIAVAGGYAYRAFKEKFALIREDGRKVVAGTSTPIFAGDMIEVYERYF